MSSPDTSLAELPETKRRIPAFVMSFLLHATLLTAGGLMYRVVPRGIPEADRGAGIVLVQASASGATQYFSDAPADSSSSGGARATTNAAPQTPSAANIALPGPEQMPVSPGPQLPSGAAAIGLPGEGDGIPGAGGLGTGRTNGGGPKGINGDATLQVFGVQGTGSRFVFVFDRSASMSGHQGRPLAAAKRELIASLESLGKLHQFQIIFYNEEPHVYAAQPGRTPQLSFADDESKRRAVAFVEGVSAAGGTRHTTALVVGLSMSPDVIFFLTDADEPQLTSDDLQRIRSKNRRGTTINCVEFGAGASSGDDNFLKRLAKQNGGQHAYVDVTRLAPAK